MFVPQILYMKYLVNIWFYSTNWLLNPKVEYGWHFIPRNLAKQRNGMSIAIPFLFHSIPESIPFLLYSIPAYQTYPYSLTTYVQKNPNVVLVFCR